MNCSNWAGKYLTPLWPLLPLPFILALPPFSFWPGAVIGTGWLANICLQGDRLFALRAGALTGLGVAIYALWGSFALSVWLLTQMVVVVMIVYASVALATAWLAGYGILGGLLSAVVVGLSELACGWSGFPFSHNVFWVNSPLQNGLLPWLGAEWQAGIYWFVALYSIRWLAIAFLLTCLLFSFWVPNGASPFLEQRAAIVQTWFNDELINFPGLPGRLEYRFQALERLLEQANQHQPDLILIPESSLPFYTQAFTQSIRRLLSGQKESTVVFHQYRYRGDGFLDSVNVALGPGMARLGESGKQSPVPIAEPRILVSVPISEIDWSGGTLLALVCSDSLRSVNLRTIVRRAGVILMTANDNSLAGSLMPELHLRMDQIRAAELGLPMLRAVNGGPSAVIDARGWVASRLAEGRQGLLMSGLPQAQPSFFLQNLRLIVAASVLLIALCVFMLFRSSRASYERQDMMKPYPVMGALLALILILITLLFTQTHAMKAQPAIEVTDDASSPLPSPEQFLLRQLGILDTETVNPEVFFQLVSLDVYGFHQDIKWPGLLVDTVSGRVLILDKQGNQFLVYSAKGLTYLTVDQLKNILISDIYQIKVRFVDFERLF